jgi:dihydroorotase
MEYHPQIRSVEACYAATEKAINLALEYGTRLHVLLVSTAMELKLFDDAPLQEKQITAEACVPHLLFTSSDYEHLGARIKCNPAIKDKANRTALRWAVNRNHIDTIATDHAPHLLADKEGGALKAASGIPMIQFSLLSMLELVRQGVFSIETIVQKMCHAPAMIYGIRDRGFIRPGYKADLVLVRLISHDPWTITDDKIRSKCGWSPLEGETIRWTVEKTFVNGNLVYSDNRVDMSNRGKPLYFG